jgi:hypothetical protein
MHVSISIGQFTFEIITIQGRGEQEKKSRWRGQLKLDGVGRRWSIAG